MCILIDCLLIQQASQIDQLQSTVNSLTAQISEFVSSKSPNVAKASTSVAQASECMETSSDIPTSNKRPSKSQIMSEPSTDCKSNVVVFGIPECKPEIMRLERLAKDSASVTTIFQKINFNLNESVIHDCFCLGHYNQSREQFRPILVKFNYRCCQHFIQ